MAEMSEAIVLEDSEGSYYVIPREALEEARVPASAKAAVDDDLGDTQGFSLNFTFVGGLSLAPTRVSEAYGFRGTAWPCDSPAFEAPSE
jgi:hypothetical protein